MSSKTTYICIHSNKSDLRDIDYALNTVAKQRDKGPNNTCNTNIYIVMSNLVHFDEVLADVIAALS
jgi:hypothetical protein